MVTFPIRRVWFGVPLLLGLSHPVVAQNLLTNGDFETGNTTGFTTALALDNSGQIAAYSSYDIRTTAATAGTGWGPSADHTTGLGTDLFITRGANGNNTVTALWVATISSTTSTRYTFSGYAAVPTSLTANQTPKFKLVVTGGGGFNQTFNFASPTTSWGLFEVVFLYTGNSGNVTYTLSMINGSSGNGQADAISWDDFVLTAPEPSTYAAGVALVGIVACHWRAAAKLRRIARSAASAA